MPQILTEVVNCAAAEESLADLLVTDCFLAFGGEVPLDPVLLQFRWSTTMLSAAKPVGSIAPPIAFDILVLLATSSELSQCEGCILKTPNVAQWCRGDAVHRGATVRALSACLSAGDSLAP